MKGRKPIPAGIKALRGNPGKRRLPAPLPSGDLPKCPSHLSAEAKREWNRVLPELAAAGLISTLDRALLAGYCQCWALSVQCQVILKKEGMLVDARADDGTPRPSTGAKLGGGKKHPAVGILRDALIQLRAYAGELGMGAVNRARMPGQAAKQDSLEVFIGPQLARKDSA